MSLETFLYVSSRSLENSYFPYDDARYSGDDVWYFRDIVTEAIRRFGDQKSMAPPRGSSLVGHHAFCVLAHFLAHEGSYHSLMDQATLSQPRIDWQPFKEAAGRLALEIT